jgi:tetraacyldisaccharide 4'-kinase
LSLEQRITYAWQRDSVWLKLLLPLAWLFTAIAGLRRLYLQSRYQGHGFDAPVVVVGNISVGGSGKTPLIVALVSALKQHGFKPGVVSRGYGGSAARYPLAVHAETAVAESGDEPLLIAQLADCPVVVDADRTAAVAYLLSHNNCDLVLSDDGLQHYRLHRDIEIAVVDGQRGFGNGRCLPAGPLREGAERLQQVDFVVLNGARGDASVGDIFPSEPMQIVPRRMTQLCSGVSLPIEQWLVERETQSVHAVAAIGNPQRFADTLAALGLDAELHSFNDHQALSAVDLHFEDDLAVIVTAKDAVKLLGSDHSHGSIADNIWVLDIEARIESDFIDRLAAQLRKSKV